MKQAGHEWFRMLRQSPMTGGLQQCIMAAKDSVMIIGAHVDNLIGIAPTNETVDEVERSAERQVELE